MNVRFYMDVHVPRAITEGLRLRSIDVLTAHEDSARDADLLAEATQRQRAGRSFAGLVYAHQLQVTIGQCVHSFVERQSSTWRRSSPSRWTTSPRS